MPITNERRAYNRDYQQRTHRVAVTLTPEEYRDLTRQAKAQGVRPTTLAKRRMLAQREASSRPPEIVRDELRELRFLLRNVANNINQIAHHSNMVKHLADENGLLLEIKKMEEAIFGFVEREIQPVPAQDDTVKSQDEI